MKMQMDEQHKIYDYLPATAPAPAPPPPPSLTDSRRVATASSRETIASKFAAIFMELPSPPKQNK